MSSPATSLARRLHAGSIGRRVGPRRRPAASPATRPGRCRSAGRRRRCSRGLEDAAAAALVVRARSSGPPSPRSRRSSASRPAPGGGAVRAPPGSRRARRSGERSADGRAWREAVRGAGAWSSLDSQNAGTALEVALDVGRIGPGLTRVRQRHGRRATGAVARTLGYWDARHGSLPASAGSASSSRSTAAVAAGRRARLHELLGAPARRARRAALRATAQAGRSYQLTGKVAPGSVRKHGDRMTFRVRDRTGTRPCRSATRARCPTRSARAARSS